MIEIFSQKNVVDYVCASFSMLMIDGVCRFYLKSFREMMIRMKPIRVATDDDGDRMYHVNLFDGYYCEYENKNWLKTT